MPLTTLQHSETRIDGFSHEDKLQFLQLLKEHKNPYAVCQLLGISPSTYQNHKGRDEWFNEQVTIVKHSLAYSLVPRQFERALANSTTDSIWLQKVLGGSEFNPESKHSVELTVNLPSHRPVSTPLGGTHIPGSMVNIPTSMLSIPGSMSEGVSQSQSQGWGHRVEGEGVFVPKVSHILEEQKGVSTSSQSSQPVLLHPEKSYPKHRKTRKCVRARYQYVKAERPECTIHPGVRHYKACLGERQNVAQKGRLTWKGKPVNLGATEGAA